MFLTLSPFQLLPGVGMHTGRSNPSIFTGVLNKINAMSLL
jgi:hypothetical protein